MAKKRNTSFIGNKLATTIGEVFYTNKEIMAEFDAQKIGKSVEMLVIEINQQKYEEYFIL